MPVNSLELIASLRRQAESICIPNEARPAPDSSLIEGNPGSVEYVSDCMRRYNYEAFLEMTDRETRVVDADVDNDAIAELESILNAYMESYAPDQPDLKNYIRIVSLYLAFVAKQPLHPPNIMVSESDKGTPRKSRYYCAGGRVDLDERFPICQYCTASSRTEPAK